MVRWLRVVLGTYVLACLVVVFWPTPVDRGFSAELNQVIAQLRKAGFSFMSYNLIEITANVAMFVPLGVLTVLAFPRVRWWAVPAGCLALSAAVELTQWALISQRFASILDVAANTLGALLGALGVMVWRAVASKRSATAEALPRAPDTTPQSTRDRLR